jgi:hypothetical protein
MTHPINLSWSYNISWAVESYSAGQWIPCIHGSWRPRPILNQLNPGSTFTSCFYKIRREPSAGGLLCYLLRVVGSLFGLLFDPEGGSDMFLWKVRWLSTDYKALHPRRKNSTNYEYVNHFSLFPCSPCAFRPLDLIALTILDQISNCKISML